MGGGVQTPDASTLPGAAHASAPPEAQAQADAQMADAPAVKGEFYSDVRRLTDTYIYKGGQGAAGGAGGELERRNTWCSAGSGTHCGR